MRSIINSALSKHSICNLRDVNNSIRNFRRAFIKQSRFNECTIDYMLSDVLLSDSLRD